MTTATVLTVSPHPLDPSLLIAYGANGDLIARALHRPVMLDGEGRLVGGFPRAMLDEVRAVFGRAAMSDQRPSWRDIYPEQRPTWDSGQIGGMNEDYYVDDYRCPCGASGPQLTYPGVEEACEACGRRFRLEIRIMVSEPEGDEG